MLAAKTALAVRYDALGEDVDTEMGIQNRAKLESRIRFLEEGGVSQITLPVYNLEFHNLTKKILNLLILHPPSRAASRLSCIQKQAKFLVHSNKNSAECIKNIACLNLVCFSIMSLQTIQFKV